MERTYIIPLRKEWQKAPMYKRTKKATAATKAFLVKHMKIANVKLGRHLNMKLWSQGYRHPPHKVEVSVELIKDKEGDYVYAELVGVKKETLKREKTEKKTGLAGKIDEFRGKGSEQAEHKIEEVKAEEKAIKELKNPKAESQNKIEAEKGDKKKDMKDRTKNVFSDSNKQQRSKK
ncbi:MAG TPA: hypothetical protein HA360_04230 [Nanoarchaeota archaeon]|nr:hypothetical protein [Nanoarchaeota archaeon]HII14256.1 hypothetical protein [Nanoarchaeota archaeon]